MTEANNAAMDDFWNGDGGHTWMSFEDRLEASLSPLGNSAIAAAKIQTDDQVLDVGCGCDGTSISMAQQVGTGGAVHGVDISRPLLQRATANARTANVHNVAFTAADAQVYTFEANRYDVVFSRFGVMFFDDPIAAFTNLWRALKPGGRLTFICWQSAQDNEWVRRPLSVVAQHIPLPSPSEPGEPGPFSLSDKDRVHAILSAAGFTGTTTANLRQPFVLGDDPQRALEFLLRLSPSGGAVRQANPDEPTRTSIARDMLALFEKFAADRGVIMDSASMIVTAQKPA